MAQTKLRKQAGAEHKAVVDRILLAGEINNVHGGSVKSPIGSVWINSVFHQLPH